MRIIRNGMKLCKAAPPYESNPCSTSGMCFIGEEIIPKQGDWVNGDNISDGRTREAEIEMKKYNNILAKFKLKLIRMSGLRADDFEIISIDVDPYQYYLSKRQ